MNKAATVPLVMVVDDVPANLKLLTVMLHALGYQVQTFTSGRQAIDEAINHPPDIILLDISMPDMNGFEVCTALKAETDLKEVPVLFISALSDTADKLKGFEVGGVDYITKPFHIDEVKARVETHLELKNIRYELRIRNTQLEQLVEEKVKEIYDSQIATIFALAKLAENRDNDTGKHVERVQNYTKVLAENMKEHSSFKDQIDDSFVINLFHATPLHDIGKVSIPDNILLKPGKLTPEEFEVIKTHTLTGAQTLETVKAQYQNNSFLDVGLAVTRSHHERWDGKGYPDGLAGEDIPLAGRIMAIADVYDALRSERVYKPAFTHEKTCDIIFGDSGTQFDPHIIEVFRTVEPLFSEISNKMEDEENGT